MLESRAEAPDVPGANPGLSDAQIAALSTRGNRRKTEAGEVLFREGDRRCDFFVVLDGIVEVVSGYEDDPHVHAIHGRGGFLGDLSLLTGQAVFATAVVREPGEVLVIPVERLREIVTQEPDLGDLILRAYLLRRSILLGSGSGLRIVGSRYSPDTRRLREFAARNRVPHRWIDLENDREAEALLQRLGVAPDATPVVIWGRRVLRNPSTAELANAIGLPVATNPAVVVDLVVVGAGPAGLAAAVYGASEGLTTVVLDAVAAGGQAGTSPRIENYLGFPSGLSGSELAERAIIQAEKFGVHIMVPAEAASLETRDGNYVVHINGGDEIQTRAVLVASGAHYRKLPVERLEEFEGTSVFYAATEIEARVCGGDPVAVVGGGNSAGQASLFLADRAAHVQLIIRGDDLGKNMSRYLVDRVERHSRIEILRQTEVRELVGDGALHALVVEDRGAAGARRKIDARALFVFIGAEPHARWLAGSVELDDRGFVLTGTDIPYRQDWNITRPPFPLETSRPGVFAVGDVRSRSIKRVAAAVGEGSMGVRLVHEHLETLAGPTTSGSPKSSHGGHRGAHIGMFP